MDTQINSRTPKLLIFLIGAVVGVILAASIFWVKSYINNNFKAKVGLEEGENTITVYSFDVNSGESVQTSLNILYLAEEFALNNVLVAAENTDTIKKNTDRIQKLKEQISTSSPELKKNSSSLKRTHVF